jgi:hypothetical protein
VVRSLCHYKKTKGENIMKIFEKFKKAVPNILSAKKRSINLADVIDNISCIEFGVGKYFGSQAY